MDERARKLIETMEREARRTEFPIDTPVYESAGLDPYTCILYAGSLDAPIAFFGRDLGKDEVAAQQPLIGAGGKLVRAGVWRALGHSDPHPTHAQLDEAASHVLLTNTVPWKPPGNKAYTEKVKTRFRPYVFELLATLWRGNRLVTLGTEAFQWFEPYARDTSAFSAFWKREDRYEQEIEIVLPGDLSRGTKDKVVTLAPLPHPSPLNQRWYARFPELLDARLANRFTAPPPRRNVRG